MILAGLDKLISLEPFWPGRVNQMGLVFGLGLATEEANIFTNSLPPNSLMQILCLSELSYNQSISTGFGFRIGLKDMLSRTASGPHFIEFKTDLVAYLEGLNSSAVASPEEHRSKSPWTLLLKNPALFERIPLIFKFKFRAFIFKIPGSGIC
jgi:hypothetical protein